MDWEAFKYRRKSGKDRDSAQSYAIFCAIFAIVIGAELIWGFSGWDSRYGSAVSVDRSLEPGKYWGFIVFQVFVFSYLVYQSFKKYTNAKRYLKGKKNDL